MIKIYDPESLMEAQCLKDVLESRKIVCHIGGGYLSGAVGELPAAGLLGLYVNEEDASIARELVEDYLQAMPVFDD